MDGGNRMTSLSYSVPLLMNEECKEEYVLSASLMFYPVHCLLTVSSKDLLKGKGAFMT